MKLIQKLRSVRFVLTFYYSVVLLTAFAIFGFSVYLYMERLEDTTLRKNLLEEVDWISRLVDLERVRRNGSGSFAELTADLQRQIHEHFSLSPRYYTVELTSAAGEVIFQSENRQLIVQVESSLPPNETIIREVRDPGSGTFILAARRNGPFVIEVAFPETAASSVLSNLLSVFAVLVPVVLFVAFAGGWVMAGVALRPISQISALADRISARNLSERIPGREVDDELGKLITTVNGMIARLQSSFEQIREFSMSVAHELKTPLTIMVGESELALGRSLSTDEVQRLLTTYLEEGVRMSRIVDDLLTLARAEAGQMTLQPEPVSIDLLLQELYDDAVILGAPKRLTVDLSDNERASVMGDPVRLRQLFRAIVSNAVKYTDPGGRIRLSSVKQDGQLAVSIEDNGIGIPPESVDRVFDRFYRVEESRSRGGSGLGLTVAKWIAEAHHGSIQVRSTPGKGSVFTVLLPLSAP